MSFPKISIVTPSYNQGQFLEETFISIISQQFPNLEILVVDGGSTDNSLDVIKKYEKHLTWWVSEKDKGQSEAINKGLARASGQIITWINSDDLLTPGALNKVAAYFSTQPGDVGLIHGGTILFAGGKDIQSDFGYSNPCLERNLAGMAFSQPSAFFLKKYIDIIGPGVNEKLHYGMDYDLFSRLACVCRFVPVKDIFSKYRLHETSKTVKDQDKFIGDWSRVFVNLCRNLGWNDILNEMKATGFFDDDIFDFYYPFNFIAKNINEKNVDKNKTLFYHFCYVLKAFYWNNQWNEARHLLKYLESRYPGMPLKEEKDILPIIRKLSLPDGLLNVIKKIKNRL